MNQVEELVKVVAEALATARFTGNNNNISFVGLSLFYEAAESQNGPTLTAVC